MGHTRPVSETIIARAKREPEFRAALIGQAVECIVENDVRTAKRLIRDYVLASTGFEALSKKIKKKPESIMRMLSDKGNPTISNMAALLSTLKKQEGISIHVEAIL
jgi:DNA-binding phage protein